jgi:uncharacterized protein (DUF1499 family)
MVKKMLGGMCICSGSICPVSFPSIHHLVRPLQQCRGELRTTFFVDDGEFLLDRVGQVIHVRSASRLRYSDLGKNCRRMEEIRSKFNSAE